MRQHQRPEPYTIIIILMFAALERVRIHVSVCVLLYNVGTIDTNNSNLYTFFSIYRVHEWFSFFLSNRMINYQQRAKTEGKKLRTTNKQQNEANRNKIG